MGPKTGREFGVGGYGSIARGDKFLHRAQLFLILYQRIFQSGQAFMCN